MRASAPTFTSGAVSVKLGAFAGMNRYAFVTEPASRSRCALGDGVALRLRRATVRLKCTSQTLYRGPDENDHTPSHHRFPSGPPRQGLRCRTQRP